MFQQSYIDQIIIEDSGSMRNQSQSYMNRISSEFESFLDAFSAEENSLDHNSDSNSSALTYSTVTVSTSDNNTTNNNLSYDYAYIKQQDDEANILRPENLKVLMMTRHFYKTFKLEKNKTNKVKRLINWLVNLSMFFLSNH